MKKVILVFLLTVKYFSYYFFIQCFIDGTVCQKFCIIVKNGSFLWIELQLNKSMYFKTLNDQVHDF